MAKQPFYYHLYIYGVVVFISQYIVVTIMLIQLQILFQFNDLKQLSFNGSLDIFENLFYNSIRTYIRKEG